MIEFLKKLFGVKKPTPKEQLERMKELSNYKSGNTESEQTKNHL